MDNLFELDRASSEALQKACAEVGVSVEAALTVVSAVSLAFTEVWDDLITAFSSLVGSIAHASQGLDNRSLREAILEEYLDFIPPRVRHLAFHHPKARVRKKNWNRMWDIYERCIQCNKT